MSAATTRQEPWTPTAEWLAWAERFDRTAGFHEEDRTEDEVLARKRAEEDLRHRGSFGTAHEGDHGLPWCVSTDVVTTTPRRAMHDAIRHWVREGEGNTHQRARQILHEAGVDEALAGIAVEQLRFRHMNRVRA